MSEVPSVSSSPDSTLLFTDWLALMVKRIESLVALAELAAERAEIAASGRPTSSTQSEASTEGNDVDTGAA